MRYNGRDLIEGANEQDYYSLRRRYTVGISSNNVWMYTVDVADDVRSGKPVVRLRRWRARRDGSRAVWRPTRAYNVRSKEQWDRAAQTVEACLSELGRMADPRFRGAFSRLDSQAAAAPGAQSQQSGSEVSDDAAPTMDELEQELMHAKAERRMAERRYRELRQHGRAYRHILSNLTNLVASPETGETEIHHFIMEHNARWLFGLEYSALQTEVWFPPGTRDFRFDLMLKRFDGFNDLVELKSPNARLFAREAKRRSRLTRPLSGALGQVIAYLNACDRFQSRDLFRPKAFIVIGKESTDAPEQRRLLQSHLTQVEILTYSSLIERGRSLLEHVRGRSGGRRARANQDTSAR
jgi:hypothetical protein